MTWRGDPKLKAGAATSQPTCKRRGASNKHTTLYDAVSGRAMSEGFLPTNSSTSKYPDTTPHSTQPIPPEETLFRLKGRPFSEENDPYWVHERLAANQPLPDPDLLKVIHPYASNFYSRTLGEGAEVDFNSLDETALLCLGMLLEEMADEVLGDTRDLALTEGEAAVRKLKREDRRSRERRANASLREAQEMSAPTEMMTEEDSTSQNPGAQREERQDVMARMGVTGSELDSSYMLGLPKAHPMIIHLII